MTDIELKRAYDAPSTNDGYRVLVDRLWPRGLSHERLPYDEWAKDLSPSDDLREWFHQDREGRWNEFVKRYESELESSPAFDKFMTEIKSKPKVTLLYGSKDSTHNQAEVLQKLLESKINH